MNPIIFLPKTAPAWIFITVTIGATFITGFGLLEILKKYSPVVRTGAVSGVVVVAIVVIALIIKGASSMGPLRIYENRIESNSWSIPFDNIAGVRIESRPVSTVINGRVSVSVNKRLVVDLVSGSREVGNETIYKIDSIETALLGVLKKYKNEK
jgi:hypothetical protein